MARMIGRTKSWVWWLMGTLCALVFSGRAWGLEGGLKPKYGVEPMATPPPTAQPSVSEKQRQAAEALVEQYLAPVAAVEPTKEQAEQIAAQLKELGGNDEKFKFLAQEELVRLGPVALGELRRQEAAAQAVEAKADPKADAPKGFVPSAVFTELIIRIERAARWPLIEGLRNLGEAGPLVIGERLTAAQAAEVQAARAALLAALKVRQLAEQNAGAQEQQAAAEEAGKLAAARAAAQDLSARLGALYSQVRPVPYPPPPPYGVTPAALPRRPRPAASPKLVYPATPALRFQAEYGVRMREAE